MSRRRLDQYFTPAHATYELQRHVHIRGSLLECCNGDGGIIRALIGPDPIFTNDIDPNLAADFYYDVSEPWYFPRKFDWVVSNPPFNQAPQIVPRAYDCARIGIAMLLRLSYLEPCFSGKSNRAQWLSEHPPTKLIVLPRISFTGDGKTDSVTCAWMVWEKYGGGGRIIVVPRPPVI